MASLLSQVEANIIRCPDAVTAEAMIDRVDEIRRRGDSVGGVVACVARNLPAGLGAPVFDKLEAELAKACMSLPAARAFEVGSGLDGILLTGRQHNDEFTYSREGDGEDSQRIRTVTNRSGGVQGGISNGEALLLRVAFKPTSTIASEQRTVARSGSGSSDGEQEQSLLRG